MLSICAAVCLGGMTTFGPGLTGIVIGMGVIVANTVCSTMSVKCPWPPPPRLDYTEMAFALSWELSSSIVSYIGSLVNM